MTQVEISVVIPTRNRLSKVEATLRSLYQQNAGGLSCEIVVVDDGSAPAVVLPQRPALPTRLVRVEGVGRSLARNTGAKSAKGKLLVFLDDDMQVGADFLAAHHRAHQQWPEALLVGAIRLPLHEQAVPFVRFRQRLEDHGIPPQRGLVSARNFCTAANMAIVRDRFLNLGGFDPSIHSSEDQDFALRYTAADGEVAFVPEAEAIHWDDALDIRSYCRRSEWGMREMMPFCLRYPDWPDNIERARINGPLHLGREPFSLSLRKVCKLALSLWPMPALLFACVSLVESRLPQSGMLDRLYRLLLGIFVFRGYRNGLNAYGREAESGRNPDAQFSAERLSP
jgi:glycosyltransferase involved in cell wall biosynthesis